ncbi:hypothetical protein [Nocardia seriolae]|uniref:Diacylglycerol O-acyltransferase n=1 Tax=Nocardia seriolae TaxID=37332 RepID=A0A0B8NAE4_9NOCA|nr:hypothetical protein [Nocardia seriolae]MTJ61392.1 hypothetical protein [Nocardia seriolae]MTJ74232.1 hypothetical protein [Nocardia seriolae]MTJ91208.1 hypothetical protein [Nocardia seriolae]MTK35173.1 hypothetical protein [Nocardia seriolae]MTK39366.1 hypothetical protein [Nocardia seriolae]
MTAVLNRLTADDDLFLKLHDLYGNALVNQLAWRFDEPLDPAVLQRFHAHLAHGFLSRRVMTTAVPFARPWWVTAGDAEPLAYQEEPVPENGVLDWFFDQSRVEFDPVTGRVWRLSAAPTTGGGTLLSLVTSHVGSDGGAVLYAVGDALRRLDLGDTPDIATSSGRLVGSNPGTGLLRAHLADGLGQLRAVALSLRAALAARNVTEPERNPRPTEPRRLLPATYSAADLVVEVDAAEWNSVAAAHNGTANGLMVGVAVGILGRSGRIADGAAVRVDIPHSMRGHDDPRGNATTGLPIAVSYRKGEHTDLRQVRSAIKQAARAYADPATTPALQHLQPVQQMLPKFVLGYFSRTAKAPECLCTNLGETGQGVATLAGVRARSVLMRPVVCTGETELFRRVEIGLNLSWSSDGETVTLAITGADPDRFPTRAALRDYVIDEFESWGLRPRFWS